MATGYTIHCGECGKDGPAEQWLDPSTGYIMQEGVLQCPHCRCRVRRKSVGGKFVGDRFISEYIVLEVEKPPYTLLVDASVDRGPFRKQKKSIKRTIR